MSYAGPSCSSREYFEKSRDRTLIQSYRGTQVFVGNGRKSKSEERGVRIKTKVKRPEEGSHSPGRGPLRRQDGISHPKRREATVLGCGSGLCADTSKKLLRRELG